MTGVSSKPSSLTCLKIDGDCDQNLSGGCWLECLPATSPFGLGFFTQWQLSINTLLTRDVLIRVLLPNFIDQRHFNIHLHNNFLPQALVSAKIP